MALSVLLMGQRFVISLTLSTDGCDHFRLGFSCSDHKLHLLVSDDALIMV